MCALTVLDRTWNWMNWSPCGIFPFCKLCIRFLIASLTISDFKDCPYIPCNSCLCCFISDFYCLIVLSLKISIYSPFTSYNLIQQQTFGVCNEQRNKVESSYGWTDNSKSLGRLSSLVINQFILWKLFPFPYFVILIEINMWCYVKG